MKSIAVMGAGKIGSTICQLLLSSGDYQVTLCDASEQALGLVAEQLKSLPQRGLRTHRLDIANPQQLRATLKDQFAVLSACPFHLTHLIAEAAVDCNCHYLDLTEDVACTEKVKVLAHKANTALIPQCGLAPGFIGIAGNHLASSFEQLHQLHLRVGALPLYPSNALKYNLSWSTEGLINEYCNPCNAIVNGRPVAVPPLEEIESFSLDGITYEAFNTSGGLGTLCETLAGKVQELNYRTVRYPGHRDIMKALLQDLKLQEKPELLKNILENAVPLTHQDVVLIFVNASGIRGGRLEQETYVNKVYHRDIDGIHRSAIQITTASSICAVLDLLAQNQLPQRGFVHQEQVALTQFLDNRFGRYYLPENINPQQTPNRQVA